MSARAQDLGRRHPSLRDATVAASVTRNGREARARLNGADPDAGCEEHLRPRAGPGPPPPPTAPRCCGRRHRHPLLRDAAMAATTARNVREAILHFIIARQIIFSSTTVILKFHILWQTI